MLVYISIFFWSCIVCLFLCLAESVIQVVFCIVFIVKKKIFDSNHIIFSKFNDFLFSEKKNKKKQTNSVVNIILYHITNNIIHHHLWTTSNLYYSIKEYYSNMMEYSITLYYVKINSSLMMDYLSLPSSEDCWRGVAVVVRINAMLLMLPVDESLASNKLKNKFLTLSCFDRIILQVTGWNCLEITSISYCIVIFHDTIWCGYLSPGILELDRTSNWISSTTRGCYCDGWTIFFFA